MILVTGGSGFLGSHTVLAALAAGHEVRTTVRSAARADEVRDAVVRAGGDPGALHVVLADLTEHDDWFEAADGCRDVLHVASPFPAAEPEHAEELIGPAREGTLQVLEASRAAGVRRVVVVSSYAAIGYPPEDGRAYDECDWTDPDDDRLPAYIRSKAEAERAAWSDVERAGAPELVVVNPTGIFGPLLGGRPGTSLSLIGAMLTGAMERVPPAAAGVVDVRDVAHALLEALRTPHAAGRRFLLTSGVRAWTFEEMAGVLRARLGQEAARVPTVTAPGGPPARPAFVTDRARDVLGFAPRPVEETLVDAARSLLT